MQAQENASLLGLCDTKIRSLFVHSALKIVYDTSSISYTVTGPAKLWTQLSANDTLHCQLNGENKDASLPQSG